MEKNVGNKPGSSQLYAEAAILDIIWYKVSTVWFWVNRVSSLYVYGSISLDRRQDIHLQWKLIFNIFLDENKTDLAYRI